MLTRRQLLCSAATVGAAGVLLLSCTDGPAGFSRPVPGRFAIAPTFTSAIAGIVDIDRIRFLVVRLSDGSTAKDTTVQLAADADSVDLSLSVLLQQPEETFTVTLALITPAGDTAFRAGPLSVQPSAGGAPVPVAAAEFVYTGVGAHAATVEIVEAPAVPVVSGTTATVVAVAYDAAGEPIPGTPIGWTSLEPGIATVPDPRLGVVLAGSQRGTARVVAQLVTGPADTVSVPVTLPPAAITAESGSGQSGPVTGLLPDPLVARVTASDGIGVPGVPVTFAVTTGGGLLSAAAVTTDAAGRASVTWTLGPNVGPQSVTARTTALPAASATFQATGMTTGAGSMMVFAGDGQAALVSTAVATAPAVIVRDAQNNPVPGTTVTFVVSQGGGSITGATATTDASGVAAVGGWTLGPTVGTNALTATVSGLSPVVFTALATGVNGAFTMVASDGGDQSATVGTLVPVAPQVTVLDTAGNPAVGVPVMFAVTAGGGSITGATPVTNASGLAAVGSWTLGTAAGTNTLVATATGLAPVAFNATGVVGPPAGLVIVSGDGQSADAGTALAQPVVVEARDAGGNAVPGVPVTWSTRYGSLAPATTTTDGAGRAQSVWTLGTNAVTQTATAQATGALPAVFTATAVFQNPSILLALTSGSNRIVSGGSATLAITLTAPAGVNGAPVTVSSDNPAIIEVASPGALTIPEGGTTGQIQLNAVGGGTTTIRATSSGYADGAVVLIASVQVLSMPGTLNVPFGGTASLPLQISTPAPAGGVVVTLVSDNPAAVALLTPTVTIAAGAQTASAAVSGVFPGLATITATTVDFGSATSRVSTTANLNIVQTSATINASFGTTLTVRLESGGSPVAAPSPGITVTMVPRDPACVAAVSPVTIPTGLVDITTAVTSAGGATLPCTSFLVATAPDIAPDSLSVTVNPTPAMTLNTTTATGSGLQRVQSGFLGVGNHGGTTVRITSSDAAIALVSPNAMTPGTAFIDIPLANGVQSFSYYVQGLEGATGTVTLTGTASGFTTGTTQATIVPPAVDVIGLATSLTSLTPPDAFLVRIGIPDASNTFMAVEEEIRAGGTALTATVNNSDGAVAALFTQVDGAAQSVMLTVPVLSARTAGTVASGGVEFRPLTAGVTTVSASIPNLIVLPASAINVTVTTPAITLNTTTNTGSGLQRVQSGFLGASNHGGATVRITSSDPAIALVSPNATTPGSAFIDLPLANGVQSFSYSVQGLEGVTGTVTLTATEPRFTTATIPATIVQPAVDVIGLATSLTSLTPPDAFLVRIGIPDAGNSFMAVEEEIRAGGTALTATVTNSDGAVADLFTAATGAAQSVTITVPVLGARTPGTIAGGGVELRPLTAGVTTVSASIPNLIVLPAAAINVTVTTPAITLNNTTNTGSGLQRIQSGFLGASNHGGATVRITSSDPAMALVSPNASTPGTAFIDIPLASGAQSFNYYVQGLEGVTGTVTLTATEPRFTTATTPATIVQPAVDVIGLATATTTLSPPDPFIVRIGIPDAGNSFMAVEEEIRAGGIALTPTVVNSNGGVGQLFTQAGGAAQSVVLTIPVLTARTPSTVNAGGVEFQPLTAGATTVSATIPGYVTLPSAAIGVTVTTPAITLNNTTNTGSGLQRSQSGFLGASNHGGTTVRITSSNPTVALVSPNATTTGTAFIDIPLAAGVQSFNYYVQGLEGVTGTVTLTAAASGFTDGIVAATVVQPAVDIIGLVSTIAPGAANDAFLVRIGIPDAGNTFMAVEEELRAGGTAIMATVSNSNATVAQLLAAAPGQSVMVSILAGQARSANTAAQGGVEFDPLAAGSTTVAATLAGFVILPAASQVVTVQ